MSIIKKSNLHPVRARRRRSHSDSWPTPALFRAMAWKLVKERLQTALEWAERRDWYGASDNVSEVTKLLEVIRAL